MQSLMSKFIIEKHNTDELPEGANNLYADQTAFQVKKNAEQSNIAIDVPVDVPWQTEVFDIGGNFASDVFTAPKTRKYHLDVTIAWGNMDQATTNYQIRLVTSNRTYIANMDISKFTADILQRTDSFSIVADMDSGDIAKIQVLQSGGTVQTDLKSGSVGCIFSGHII